MDYTLKPGDRIRVTVRNRLHGYRPGDNGTVLRAFMGSATGDIFYSVVMDKDKLTITGAVFAGDEIEPDVSTGRGQPPRLEGPAAKPSEAPRRGERGG